MLAEAWRALHLGETLADPVAWKSGGVTVDMLATFLGLLATIFPYLHVFASPEVAHAIGGAVLACYGAYSCFVRVATTPTLGIDRRDPAAPPLMSPVDDRRDNPDRPSIRGSDQTPGKLPGEGG